MYFSDVSFYLDELGGHLDFENPTFQVQRINCTLEIPENYEVYITEFSSKLVQPDNFVLLDRKQITEHRFQTISQGQRDIFAGMISLENFKTQRVYEKMGNRFLEVFTTNSKLSLLFRNSQPKLENYVTEKIIMISEIENDRDRIRKLEIEHENATNFSIKMSTLDLDQTEYETIRRDTSCSFQYGKTPLIFSADKNVIVRIFPEKVREIAVINLKGISMAEIIHCSLSLDGFLNICSHDKTNFDGVTECYRSHDFVNFEKIRHLPHSSMSPESNFLRKRSH